jgi:hypothetical protein
MDMIDEQRLRARVEALRLTFTTAADRIDAATLDALMARAQFFETWIMRPFVDTSTVDGGGSWRYMCACGAQQPCTPHPAPGYPKDVTS